MRILGIIPARLQSSRINRKPLFKLLGIECFLHVYYRAKINERLTDLVVATDSNEILELAVKHGISCIMTSSEHNNPTERIIEVAATMNDYDYYVLVNGDEVLLEPEDISNSIDCLDNSPDSIVSLLRIPFNKTNSISDFKVVCDNFDNVMYISRSDVPQNKKGDNINFEKAYHLMTFRPEALRIYSSLGKSKLESYEDHEHLRFLENGNKIKSKLVYSNTISLDSPDDIELIEKQLVDDKYFNNYRDIYNNVKFE